jgi:sulfatase maturation enzyme AslB (radical SAM superfamily)
MTADNIADMSGKQYLVEKNRVDKCRECDFFRSCWKQEEYNRLCTQQLSEKNSNGF